MNNPMKTSQQADTTGARRSQNRKNALQFTMLGLYVFPSSGDSKVPLIPLYNRADTSLTPEEIEAAVEKYKENNGRAPVHVGATQNATAVKKMWRAHPDAVPSLATGPSKLVVVDADSKDDGPRKIKTLFEELGGVPEGTPVVPTRSKGLHFYFADPESRFTNSPGLLKPDYGCDVRGLGGQCVAPGSIMEDGRRYGSDTQRLNFLRAVANHTLQPLPEKIVELIGARPDKPKDVAESETGVLIKHLEDVDWPEFTDIFESVYDLNKLRRDNDEFGPHYDDPPGADISTDRMKITYMLLRQWPDMPVEHLAVFYEHWHGAGALTSDGKGSGNYNLRDIAREYLKNKRLVAEQQVSPPSDGSQFDAVEDGPEDDEERTSEEHSEKIEVDQTLSERSNVTYIEDLRKSTPQHIDWCVKYFVARGTTSIASGLWGAGKTAVFTDIALHVAHGLSYRDRKVKKGVVIYVALENPEDVERRVRAWCETLERVGHDVSSGAFVIHRGPCTLYKANGKPSTDEMNLIEIANEASKHYGLPVSMIILDTLSQSIAPGSDREHGGIFVNAMQRISTATGANVTCLHHPTKAGEAVRGDGQLQGNVDTVINVSRDPKTGRGKIEAGSKFRIGDPSKVRFGYRLKGVEIGRDEDGDIIDVVLATEDRDANLAVDDADDEVPPIKVSDRREDRVSMFIDVARAVAKREAAEGEPLDEIALDLPTLRKAINTERSHLCDLEGRSLASLEAKGVWRVAQAAVAAGRLKARGSKYFVTG